MLSRHRHSKHCLHGVLCSLQYHVVLIQLLQPLLHLDRFRQDSYEQLVRVVVDLAKTGVELLTRYKRIYTNLFLSPLQLFGLIHLCDAVVRWDAYGESTSGTVQFCLSSLEEAKVGYPVAGPLQKMFRLSLAEYGIPVSDELERTIGASAFLGPEELLDAYIRPTYQQPISQLLPNMEADLGQEFMNRWQHIAEGSSAELESSGSGSYGREKRVAIGSLLNM